ncbi:MAG: hypothetical protein IJR93_14065, partial [Treponema sp.]|nr:hypothetical protein [Treponema sp.]
AQNGGNKNGSGTGTGKGDEPAKADTGNKSGTGSGNGSATNQNGKNGSGNGNGSGTGTGSQTAQNGKNGSGSGSGSGTGTGSQTAQNGKNGSGSGSGSGSATNQNGKNGSGSGTGSQTAQNGGNKNGSGSGSGNGSGNQGGKSTGKEIAKGDGNGNGDGMTISTNGSGDANGLDGNSGSATAKDKQGLADDGTVDYVEKFSKWFHPALADVQRCGYFYTTPEICQFDMIQGDFRKVSGYKKAAYGFVFGYSQPDPRGYLSDFIRFEINVDGEYALYTWDGQNYVDLVEPNDKGTAYFYEHPAIYKGYNTLNTIKVEDTGSSYNVYVNGKLIQGNIPYLNSRATKGVMAFFSVAKEHQEDLPKTPVNVGMRITDVKRH